MPLPEPAAGLTSRWLFSTIIPPDLSTPQTLSEQISDDSGAGRVLRTRAGAGHHVWVVDWLTAVRAAHCRLGVVLAPLVVQAQWWSILVGGPAVAPGDEGHDGRDEVGTFFGQYVIVANGMVLVGTPGEHAVLDQRVEPFGEQLARNAEVALEVVESAEPDRDAREDERCPPLADDVERASQGAVEVGEAGALHVPSLAVS